MSYLQQMHGLTKKKSYGIKAPKKTYADIRLPGSGRPILPRLEVPQSQSDIYTYPSFDTGQGPDGQPPVSVSQSDSQQLQPPPRRHSADQLPSGSLVVRTSIEDRRARRRGPWLPIAPLVSSTPSSPTTATSPGTLAALQSLASMTPRLPDFVTKERITPGASDPRAAYMVVTQSAMPVPSDNNPNAYYLHNMNSAPTWSPHPGSVGMSMSMPVPMTMTMSPPSTSSLPSPSTSHPPMSSAYGDASRPFQPTPPPSLAGSDYATYSLDGSSPPSSLSSSASSLPAQADGDDQPFVVTPEYEAIVNAHFEEAIRSGAMQASMTPAIHSAVPAFSQSSAASASASAPAPAPAAAPAPHYAPSVQDHHQQQQQQQQQQQYYLAQRQDGGYAAYQMAAHPQDAQVGGGGWAPQAHVPYGHPGPGYMAPVAGYAPPQGHWYPA